MSESVTALDATFLELEQADQGAHMHIGGVLIFDPLPGGGTPAIEPVRAALGERLYELPRYRQHLSEPRVGGLRWPDWIEDEGFDVRRHVHRAALPAPGGEAELAEWAAEYYSRRLDRSRPLWEIVLVEGLERGRWALATKTHHAIVDGVGSVDVSYLMLDPDPEPPPRRVRGPTSEPGRTGVPAPPIPDRVRSLISSGARLGAKTAGLLRPGQARAALEAGRAAVETLVRDELDPAPSSSINRPIGAHRRLAIERFDLAELKAIEAHHGGTINDVVLAATAAGLRDLLLARGEEPPEQGLRAMVPVNIRAAGEHDGLGNKVSSLFVRLPVAEADPAVRYRRLTAETEERKSGHEALGSQTVVEALGLAPPAVHSFLARSAFAARLFNLTITNIPGPQASLYAHGARLREIWPLVPIAADHAIGLAVISYDGRMFFCLNVDRDSTGDVDLIAAGIRREIEALSAAARA